MDLNTRIEIVQLYYASSRSPRQTLRAYKKIHNCHTDPFSDTSIRRLIDKFEKSGSVADAPRSGRPSLVEERADDVSETLQELKSQHHSGVSSTTAVSRATGLPQKSVYRILKHHLKLYPYRLQVTQAITNADKEARLNFANHIISNRNILESVLWSDEAYFSLNGYVNRHNSVVWGSEKPKDVIAKSLHAPKVCVWMAFSSTYKLKPYFFDDTVTSDGYLDTLQHHMIPQLRRKRKMDSVIFQQDGPPPYFSNNVRQFLTSKFGDGRIIGRGFQVNWPAHSPDLNPLDFYFWGAVKARVFHNFIPPNLDSLKERIKEVISDVSQEEMEDAVCNLLYRLELVQEEDGGIIEHLK